MSRTSLSEAARFCILIMIVACPQANGADLFNDLLFRATFDDTTTAELHKGDGVAQVEGPLQFEAGQFGRAVVVGDQFARIRYTVGSHAHPQNLSCRAGSLSFRFMAVDWQPDEHFSHLFFRVTEDALLRIFSEDGELVFETGSDFAQRVTLRASLAEKQQGTWIHVVVTWDVDQVQIFLDGTLVAHAPCEDRFLSYAFNTQFEIGDTPRGMGRPGPRRTLIDDLTIYRRALEAGELDRVETPTTEAVAPVPVPPAVAIPRTHPAPRVDGQFDPREWRDSAALTNFASVDNHRPAPMQTTAHVAHDKTGIYFCVRSPLLDGVDLKAQRLKRDDDVWQDDAIQIYLTFPSGNRVLFVGNSVGTIHDRLYTKGIQDDIAWDGDWRYRSNVSDGVWTAEVGITFAALGVPSPANGETWRLNVTRDRTQPQNLSAWPVLSNFSDTVKHGTLTFLHDGVVVGIAPSWKGIGTDAVDLTAVIRSTLDREHQVEVAWRVAALGRIILEEEELLSIPAKGEAQALLQRQLGVTPDLVVATVRDPHTQRVLYEQSSHVAPRDDVHVTFQPVPSRSICTVGVKVDHPDLIALQLTACVTLSPGKGSATPVVLEGIPLADGRGTAQFDLQDLVPGHYTAHAEVRLGKRIVATGKGTFTKPEEPWRGSTVGLSATPPPPWPPIGHTVDADGMLTVRCWNRVYRFNGTALPTSIENGGTDVLASPVRVETRVAGRVQPWNPGRLTVASHDANQVSFTTTQHSERLAAATRTYVEFDGMLWTEITLTPRSETVVEGIDLVVPIPDAFAKYIHWPGDTEITGNLGREIGWRWTHALPKYAYLWIGNDDLGLTWFFETWGQFHLAEAATTVMLERQDGSLALRIRYLGEPVDMSEPLVMSFGIQATPTRPRPPGWRSWGGGNVVGTNIDVSWTAENLHRYGCGYPEAANRDFYRRFIANTKAKGWKAVPYNALLFSANDSPEMRYNVADWDLGGGINKYSDNRPFWWGRRICGAAESYSAFFAWKAKQYIEQCGIDGLYHDLQWSYRCGSDNHGYDEPHRSIRGDRALNRRVYTMLKQLDRPTWKFDHASNFICSVTSPFSDIFTTGEEMRRMPPEGDHPHHKVKSNYFHNMRLDYFKACGATGRQWGVVPMLLTQMTSNDDPGYTESLYAILLAHDAAPTWEALMRDIRYQRRVQRTLEEFGIGSVDVNFLPYWHATTPVQVRFTPDHGGPVRPFQVEYEVLPHQRLKTEESYGASVYCRDGKRSLVVLFNYTQDDGVATVTFDLAKLGLSSGTVVATDAFTRRSWIRADQPFAVEVKSLNHRLIWVEPAEDVAVVSAFPSSASDVMAAGYRPDHPHTAFSGRLVAGDFHGDPRRADRFRPDAPRHMELAQTFTLADSARIHRVELSMKDSSGAFAVRNSLRMAITTLTAEGLPGEKVMVANNEFASTWVDPRAWSYRHFELKRAKVLPAGRYALVLTKPPESGNEYFHAQFPTGDANSLSGEYVATRHPGAHNPEDTHWRADRSQVLCFGVYAIE